MASPILRRLALDLDEFRQNRMCAYHAGMTQTCDCKYLRPESRGHSEMTGCPELRDIVAELLEYALVATTSAEFFKGNRPVRRAQNASSAKGDSE